MPQKKVSLKSKAIKKETKVQMVKKLIKEKVKKA